MSRTALVFALAFCLASSALAQQAQDNPHVHVTRLYGQQAISPSEQTITYNGGPILDGTTSVYVIYYGKFTAKDRAVTNTFLSKIGGSPLYNVNTTYFNAARKHIKNVVKFNPKTNTVNDNYSLGKNLTDAQVQGLVGKYIKNKKLPNDKNGVYFVFTAEDVTESAPFGSFCTVYCGYHGPSTSIVRGETIKYSFVGNAATQCPTGCIGNIAVFGDSNSPNNDPGADGAVSVMFHELSESVSDPEVNLNTAWADPVNGESGDMCNFVFGPTFQAANGSHANQHFGGHPYLIQEMFKLLKQVLPTDPGVCVQKK